MACQCKGVIRLVPSWSSARSHQLNEAKLVLLVPGAELRPCCPKRSQQPSMRLQVILAHRCRSSGLAQKEARSSSSTEHSRAVPTSSRCKQRGVSPSQRHTCRDFTPTLISDVRNINEGEPDPSAANLCASGSCRDRSYLQARLQVLREHGCSRSRSERQGTTPIMGSYGIGIERILTAAIEQSAANRGVNDRGEISYALAPSIAPFEVVVTVTSRPTLHSPKQVRRSLRI